MSVLESSILSEFREVLALSLYINMFRNSLQDWRLHLNVITRRLSEICRFGPEVVNWIASFLRERKQRMIVNGQQSELTALASTSRFGARTRVICAVYK